MPKVSVIIPVYNVEPYLGEALDSVLRQTLQDFEIIAVNDGSTDGSRAILEAYRDRIRIIDKPNGGQGAARNDALKIACGDYICFLDSDDWIEPDTLQACYDLCERDNLDFTYFDAVNFGEKVLFNYSRASIFPGVHTGPETMCRILDSGVYACSVCMGLYRRSFLERTGVRFPEGFIHEDELYSAVCYFNASRVEPLDRVFYHRRCHAGSTMTTTFSRRNLDGYMNVLKGLPAAVSDLPMCGDAKRKLDLNICICLMHNGWSLDFRSRSRIVLAILRRPWTFRPKPFAILLFKKFLR